MRKSALLLFLSIFLVSEGLSLYAESTATVISVRGRAQVRGEEADEWQAIVRETIIRENDSIRTGSDTYLELDLGGAARVTIISPAVIKLKTFNKNFAGNPQIGLRISSGKYRFVVDKNQSPVFVAETKDARLAVKGTDFLLDAGVEKSGVYVLSGLVSLNNVFQTGTPIDIPPGLFAEVSRDASPGKTEPIPEAVYREWNLPMPPVAKTSSDLVIPKESSNASSSNTTPVSLATNASPTNLAATNQSKTNTASTNQKPKPVIEKDEPDPIFPPFPWKFEMKNQLGLSYFMEPTNKSPYGYTTFSVGGLALSNFNHWLTLTWIPEFRYGPFAIGLYLPITFGARDQFYLPTQWYNTSEWDFNSYNDVLVKLAFFEFKIWRFSFRYGGFPGLTWGSGYILNGFNNMIDFPTKKVNGLLLGYEDKKWGLNAYFFNGDLSQKLIGGARVEVQPVRLFSTPSQRKNLGLLGSLTLGASYVNLDQPAKEGLTNSLFDTNQSYSNLLSLAYASTFTNATHNLDGFGLDLTLPIGKDPFTIIPYLNFGTLGFHLSNTNVLFGPGLAAGVRGDLAILKYRGELYYNSQGFTPGMFDTFSIYDGPRAQKIGDLFLNATNSVGALLSVGANFGKLGYIQASFEEYYNATDLSWIRNQLSAEITLKKGAIKYGWGRAYYQRRNFTLTELTTNLFTASTLVGAEAHIKVLGPIELILLYTLSFADSTSQPTGNFSVTVNMDFNAAPAAAGAAPAATQ